jgi:hypothetical protein
LELRRALLLFAIVLGVAALVTSVSSPPERDRPEEREAPAERPRAAPRSPSARSEGPVAVRFGTKGRPRQTLIATGRPAIVTVTVEKPGEVRLDGLGLSSPAEPLTPARFDVLPSGPGHHPVKFAPAGTREEKTIGILRVESSR